MASKNNYDHLDKILDEMKKDPGEIVRRKNAGTYEEEDTGDGVDFSNMSIDEIRQYLDNIANQLGS